MNRRIRTVVQTGTRTVVRVGRNDTRTLQGTYCTGTEWFRHWVSTRQPSCGQRAQREAAKDIEFRI